VSGVWGWFGYFDVSYVSSEAFAYVFYAVGDVLFLSLDEHLDSAVGQVFYIAGELVSKSNPLSGESEADALNRAGEYYVIGEFFHFFRKPPGINLGAKYLF